MCFGGRDVTMDMVSVLSQTYFIGKFEFIKLNRNEILDWIQCKWNRLYFKHSSSSYVSEWLDRVPIFDEGG